MPCNRIAGSSRYVVSGVLLLLAASGCTKTTEETPEHPRHVLLLTVDTLRWDYMSCNGYDRPTTPFLDSLMANGLVFDRAVTPIPRTTQALASLLSGCYPHTTKVRSLTCTMAPTVTSIAHLAYHPPLRYAREFHPGYEGRFSDHFGKVVPGVRNRQFPPKLPKPVAVYQNPLSDDVNAHIRRLYAGDIRHTDDNISRLISHLREQFGDDWIILFTADHGESLGEHSFFYDHGDYVYEATLHVPLAIVLPTQHKLHRTRHVRDVVSLVDVMPTLAELMNLSLPDELPYDLEGPARSCHWCDSSRRTGWCMQTPLGLTKK